MQNPEAERTCWIIRFSDGRLMSFYGTKEEAQEEAEKESNGAYYKIA